MTSLDNFFLFEEEILCCNTQGTVQSNSDNMGMQNLGKLEF